MITNKSKSFDDMTPPFIHNSFSHDNIFPDDERRELEQRYLSLFQEDKRFNRQVVSFQANKNTILHSWIKYREGFSSQLVYKLLQEFDIKPGDVVFDPFAGSCTTLLVSKSLGIDADGIELLPNCHLSWEAKSRFPLYNPDELNDIAKLIETAEPYDTGIKFPHIVITETAFSSKTEQDIMYFTSLFQEMDISENARILMRLIITGILEEVSFTRKDGQYLRWDYRSSKVQGRNEIRQAQGKKLFKKVDKGELPTVKAALLRALQEVILDITDLQQKSSSDENTQHLIKGNTLEILPTFPANRYACVITSPPYANRYDYTRTYALELAYLGIGNEIFTLRQTLLSCTVESRSKTGTLKNFYQNIGALDRYEFYLSVVRNTPAFNEVNNALKIRWDKGDMNNKGVLPMIEQYLTELCFVFGEIHRTCRPGAYVAFVNDDVRYGGEIIPIDTITTNFAEKLGFEPVRIYVLQQRKGNSSQQMGRFGREELRKCITVWKKPL
jgi:site-specific DNA-methyltransferase (cytosine-N4-specific)